MVKVVPFAFLIQTFLMKPKPFHFFLFLLVTGFAIYFPIINTTFFADDFYVLNRLMKGVFSAGNLFRPLSDASIYLDYLLWGNHAAGFHVTSLLLHIITSFLVFCVFRAINNIPGVAMPGWLAPVAGFLFLVYPFHNEPVVWIVGRGIILAALFCILSLYLYLMANGRKKYYALASLFYFIALFGYESVLVFPFMLLVIEIAVAKGKINAGIIKKTIPFWVALLIYIVIRIYFIGGLIGADDYFRITFSPLTLLLNLFRLIERSFIVPLESYKLGMALAIAVCAALIFALLKRKAGKQSIGLLITCAILYVLSVLPAITIGINTHTIEGERFLYFPSVFFVGGLVIYSYVVAVSPAMRNLFMAVLVFYFGICLIGSNSRWRASSAIVSAVTSNSAAYSCTGTLFIIDLPDNVKGAIALRNGFSESFAVLNRSFSVGKEVKILSRKALDDRLQPTRIERLSEELIVAGGFRIKKVPGGFTPGWMIFGPNDDSVHYELSPGDKIFFFDGVTLQQLAL